MKVIDLYFESVEDLSAGDLFGAVGVYFLWAPNARAKPTYVGQGDLMARLSKHSKAFSKGVTGVVAITGYQGEKKGQALKTARLAEAIMLEAALQVKAWPRQNRMRGQYSILWNLVEREGFLRVNIRGHHPLKRPDQPHARLRARVVLTVAVEYSDDQPYLVWQIPWRRRA